MHHYCMFNRARLTVPVLILFLPAAVIADAKTKQQGVWKKVSAKSGIQVWKRSVPGTSLLEFQAVGTVNSSVLRIMSVVHNVRAYPQWVPRNKETRIVKRISDTEMIFFFVTKGFWPVADREYVGRFRLKVDDANRRLNMYVVGIPPAQSYKYVPRTGGVRMPKVWSRWTLEAKGKERTLVRLYVFADPGGYIPTWIVNWAAGDVPHEMITNLRERARRADALNPVFMRKYKRFESWR